MKDIENPFLSDRQWGFSVLFGRFERVSEGGPDDLRH